MRPNPRASATVLAFVLVSVTVFCDPASAAPAPVIVRISNFVFDAETLTVPAGTTVTWVNQDDDPHTIVSDDKTSFRSRALDTNDSFSFTFAKPGTFGYFCSIHPHMTGKVVVEAP
jgi:plastocyanin